VPWRNGWRPAATALAAPAETVRLYAREQLDKAGETTATTRRQSTEALLLVQPQLAAALGRLRCAEIRAQGATPDDAQVDGLACGCSTSSKRPTFEAQAVSASGTGKRPDQPEDRLPISSATAQTLAPRRHSMTNRLGSRHAG
jgi:hypothetical protein